MPSPLLWCVAMAAAKYIDLSDLFSSSFFGLNSPFFVSQICLVNEITSDVVPMEMPACFSPNDVSVYFPNGLPIMDDLVHTWYSSSFGAIHVIGARDKTAIIQWTTNDDTIHFAVMRLCQGEEEMVYKTLAVHIPEDTEDFPLIYEATISPGQNQFLLRPNQVLCNRFMKEKLRDSMPCNYVSVIDLELGRLKSPPEGPSENSSGQAEEVNFGKCLHTADLFENVADQMAYAYDPRFPADRIAKVWCILFLGLLYTRQNNQHSIISAQSVVASSQNNIRSFFSERFLHVLGLVAG